MSNIKSVSFRLRPVRLDYVLSYGFLTIRPCSIGLSSEQTYNRITSRPVPTCPLKCVYKTVYVWVSVGLFEDYCLAPWRLRSAFCSQLQDVRLAGVIVYERKCMCWNRRCCDRTLWWLDIRTYKSTDPPSPERDPLDLCRLHPVTSFSICFFFHWTQINLKPFHWSMGDSSLIQRLIKAVKLWEDHIVEPSRGPGWGIIRQDRLSTVNTAYTHKHTHTCAISLNLNVLPPEQHYPKIS